MAFTIGLTGGIGTGKSSVAAILKELGAEVIVGDELGRSALDREPNLRERLIARYGEAVLTGGKLDRAKLADCVFTGSEQTRWLTHITFPFIYEQWQRALKASRAAVVVFDAALIFEWGIEGDFDAIIVVTAADDAIAKRASDGKFSPAELRKRQALQLPVEHKLAGADFVIENNGTPVELRRRVEEVWNQLTMNFDRKQDM